MLITMACLSKLVQTEFGLKAFPIASVLSFMFYLFHIVMGRCDSVGTVDRAIIGRPLVQYRLVKLRHNIKLVKYC